MNRNSCQTFGVLGSQFQLPGSDFDILLMVHKCNLRHFSLVVKSEGFQKHLFGVDPRIFNQE